MILLLMAVSLIGTVILTGICAPLAPAVPPAAYFPEQGAAPYVSQGADFDLPIEGGGLFSYAAGGREMRSDTIKDQMRRGIVERSIEILRRHGKSDEEIRSMILNDFHISGEALEELLEKSAE